MSLTKGSVSQIKQRTIPEGVPVVLQVLEIKNVVANDGKQTRFRMLLTDGVDTVTGMPVTQLNELIGREVKENSIVRANKYSTSLLNNQVLIVIMDVEVLGQGVPIALNRAGAAPAAAPAAAQPSYGAATTAPAYGSAPAAGAFSSAPANPYGAAPSPYGAPSAPPMSKTEPLRPPQQPYGAAPGPAANPYTNTPYGGGANKAVQRDDSAGMQIVPISGVNPYSSKWTIKARITSKGDKRTWQNARGEGTLFSVDLLDSFGGEIRGTFFKDACEKFYPQLEEGKVYTFSGGTVKAVTNKQFSTVKNNYEITFNVSSEIRAVSDDSSIKTQHYAFVKIDALAMTEPNSTVDLLATVRSHGDVAEIVSTKLGGRTLQKRDLVLVDDSGCEIKLTLWGEKALAAYDWASKPIVAFKAVRVGDYGGRSLSTSNTTSIAVNPLIPEARALHDFRSRFPNGDIPVGSSLSNSGGAGGAGGAGGGADALERRKSVSAIRDEGLGMGEKPDYVSVKGTVVYIRHDSDPWYTACPTEGCNKKVVEGMNGRWTCEKCNKDFDACMRRYILSISMADHSGSNWFSLFNDTAEQLLGHSAEEVNRMRSSGDEAGYEKVFADALFRTVVARLRVKQETVNDEQRVKSSFVKMDRVDFVSESRQMLDAIAKYT